MIDISNKVNLYNNNGEKEGYDYSDLGESDPLMFFITLEESLQQDDPDITWPEVSFMIDKE